jgi:hypothetical protein
MIRLDFHGLAQCLFSLRGFVISHLQRNIQLQTIVGSTFFAEVSAPVLAWRQD